MVTLVLVPCGIGADHPSCTKISTYVYIYFFYILHVCLIYRKIKKKNLNVILNCLYFMFSIILPPTFLIVLGAQKVWILICSICSWMLSLFPSQPPQEKFGHLVEINTFCEILADTIMHKQTDIDELRIHT